MSAPRVEPWPVAARPTCLRLPVWKLGYTSIRLGISANNGFRLFTRPVMKAVLIKFPTASAPLSVSPLARTRSRGKTRSQDGRLNFCRGLSNPSVACF